MKDVMLRLIEFFDDNPEILVMLIIASSAAFIFVLAVWAGLE